MNSTSHLGGKLGIILCCALLGNTTHGQPVAEVRVGIPVPSVTVEIRTESDFYAPLSPQGEWVVVGSYGRCWRPTRVEAGWRPYCNGSWQRTDAGWYWVSDEPWAWATYHYGRWNFTEQYGWYWVPQTQWAPAWVSWHSGGGYIGWAPLYPANVRVIAPQAYVFVEERHFMEPVRRTTIVVDNTTVINRTVIHEAPAATVIEKATGRKVEAVPVQELRHKTEAAVVQSQPARTSVGEDKVRTKVPGDALPRDGKAVGTVAPPPVGKPTTAAHDPTLPARNNQETLGEKPKSAPAGPDIKPETRPGGDHTPLTKEPTTTDKHARKPEKQPPRPQAPARENPVPGEKSEPNPSDKEHDGKPKA